MTGKPQWTEAEIDRLVSIVGSHSDILEAAAEASKEFNKPITKSTLHGLLQNRRGLRYGQVLKPRVTRAFAHIADPVERREKRDETKRLRDEHADLVERLREANKRAAVVGELRGHQPPPRILRREKISGIREMTAVAALSDCHVEEVVDPAAVSWRNEFNLTIADKRLTRYFEAVRWNVEHHRAKDLAIRDLVLWLGGDLMSGYIHEELQESNELSPVETLLWLMPRIRDGIMSLLSWLKLDRIVVPCSYGNHGRTTQKTRVSTGAANSFEWLLYNVLAEQFRDEPRVTFEVTPSAHQYVDLYDRFTLHCHHGDSVQYQGGVGGIAVPLLRAKPQWDLVRRSDWTLVGHFHQYSDFGRVIVNGSLIGFGPYSQRIRASFEPPQQAFFLIDSKRGKCQSTPLWVGEDSDDRRAA